MEPNSGQFSTAKAWSGRVALWPGLGVFIGQAGDNQNHAHWAHQIGIAQHGQLCVDGPQGLLQAPAVFIRAGVPHQLHANSVITVFLDPSTAVSRALCAQLPSQSTVCAMPEGLTAVFKIPLTEESMLEDAIARINKALMPDPAILTVDSRLAHVLAAIGPQANRSAAPSRQSLARLVGLSETRFSHWFKEQTGMPLRSYRKWLKLVFGLEQVLQGQSLTEATYQAEFADQAHFSRTFLQMFGVQPSAVFSQVQLMDRSRLRRLQSPKGTSFFDVRQS